MHRRSEKKMNLKRPDKYTTTALLLVAIAAVFIVIAIVTNRGDITTVAYIIFGMVFAMTGIFALMFSEREPVDQRLFGILPAQGCINLCSLINLHGISGNAYFLPPRVTGEARVMQFNPTTTYHGSEDFGKGSTRKTGESGLVTIPSCDPLIRELRKKNALVIPDREEGLTWLLRETIEENFKFTSRVSVRWQGSKVTITFHRYPSIDGCKIIAQESPYCCTISPCPVCSLCGALIADGLDRVVTLEKCSISSSSRDVTAVFSILSQRTVTSK